MKKGELEKEVTRTIEQIGMNRRTKMDPKNPLLRNAILDILLKQQADTQRVDEALLTGRTVPNTGKLPGCRELFGDLFGPNPSTNPVVRTPEWRFMDETRGRQ